MTTDERIDLLAPVVGQFPEMGDFGNAERLRALVKSEWTVVALPPHCILHIISANTPMAGMQSLVRGLILGSVNRCKIPAVGLPHFEEMVAFLPGPLRELVQMSKTLPEEWLAEADAVIVFGNDDTVEKFRAETRPDQIFAGYGNRWSGAVIFADPDFSSIPLLVRDICLYEQMGCLSAQIVWLHDSVGAVDYGQHLASALEKYVLAHRVPTLVTEDAAIVSRWRLSAEWKVVKSDAHRIWLSQGETVWGIWLSDSPSLSCLHRHVNLQVFTDVPDLGKLRSSVSTLGVWPFASAHKLTGSGASRLCPVGEMQFPQPDWLQDGFPALGRLLREPGR